MLNIDDLRKYYQLDAFFVTNHAAERFRQRGISILDIKSCLFSGEIIKQYPDDTPFPSCLILGHDTKNIPLHIVLSDEGNASSVITAYHPAPEIWNPDLKTKRSEHL